MLADLLMLFGVVIIALFVSYREDKNDGQD